VEKWIKKYPSIFSFLINSLIMFIPILPGFGGLDFWIRDEILRIFYMTLVFPLISSVYFTIRVKTMRIPKTRPFAEPICNGKFHKSQDIEEIAWSANKWLLSFYKGALCSYYMPVLFVVTSPISGLL